MRQVDEIDIGQGRVGRNEFHRTAADGVPPDRLTGDDLLRELHELHRTRVETLRHGSDQALARHTERTGSLEDEYLRRFPAREIDPERLRSGARQRAEGRQQPGEAPSGGRTGAEQPWDPEDLAIAKGHDPSPTDVERARQELADQGPAAIERTVP